MTYLSILSYNSSLNNLSSFYTFAFSNKYLLFSTIYIQVTFVASTHFTLDYGKRKTLVPKCDDGSLSSSNFIQLPRSLFRHRNQSECLFPGRFLANGFRSDIFGQNRRVPVGSYRFPKIPTGGRLKTDRNFPKKSDRNPIARKR